MTLPYFRYLGRGSGGIRVAGTMEAAHVVEAARKLRHEGILPLGIYPVPLLLAEVQRLLRYRSAPVRELAVLWHHLHQMLAAGLPLVRALQLKEGDRSTPAIQGAVVRVRGEVEAGVAFATALQHCGVAVPPVAIAMIAAGEAGGRLDVALARLAEQADREEAVRSKVRSALSYPALLVALSLAVVGFLVSFVLPQFERIYSDLRIDLPVLTRALLWLSRGLGDYGQWLAGLLAAGLIGAVSWGRTPPGRLRLDGLWLRLPLVGDLVRRRAIARACRCLAGLLETATPVLTAMELAGDVLDNAVLRSVMADVRVRVARGWDLAGALRQAPAVPPLVAEFVLVGQETGSVPAMLTRAADRIDGDVEQALTRLVALLEPTVMLGLALVIGMVVLAVIMPIYGVLNSVQ